MNDHDILEIEREKYKMTKRVKSFGNHVKNILELIVDEWGHDMVHRKAQNTSWQDSFNSFGNRAKTKNRYVTKHL